MNIRMLFYGACCLLLMASCESHNQTDISSKSNTETSKADTSDVTQQYSEGAAKGQTLYVPVYSHIYQQNKAKTFNLTATLSIRNTSMTDSLKVNTVHYYDSNGNLVRSYLKHQKILPPLSSISYVVDEDDLTGGIGANFIVRWSAATNISNPIVEAVMISTSYQQGISFTGTARVIDEL